MSDHDSSAGPAVLQFERLEPQAGAVAPATGGVTCDRCHRPIVSAYFHINGTTACANCRLAVQQALETPRGAGPLLKAGLFGFGAALAGAALYATIIIVTNFELALVAIAIGYMVGWSVRKGARGGGRRFQVLAVALTYFSIALAYTPVAINQIRTEGAEQQKTAQQAPGAESNAPAAPAEPISFASAALGIGFILALIAALPIISIVGSLPSGVLSAIIIFVGLRQAWRMTGTEAVEISGPYRVAAAPAAIGPGVRAAAV